VSLRDLALVRLQTFSQSFGASVAVAFIAAFTPTVVAVPSLHAYCVLTAVNGVLFALLHVYNYDVYYTSANKYTVDLNEIKHI